MKVSGKQWYGAALIALVLPTGWAFYRWMSSFSSRDVPSAFHGIRIGMSVAEVRGRFDARGTFTAHPDAAAGWTLDWRPASEGASAIHRATFEFHEGLLVAIRADVDRRDPIVEHEGLVSTSGTVRRVRSRGDGLFDVLILARDCPTHASEVRRVLAGS